MFAEALFAHVYAFDVIPFIAPLALNHLILQLVGFLAEAEDIGSIWSHLYLLNGRINCS